MVRTRAAASSMASGMPSRRRQIVATAAAFASPTSEVRAGPERLGRRTGGPRRTCAHCVEGVGRGVGGHRHRRHPPHDLAWHVERLAARRDDREAGALPRQVVDQHGAVVEEMLAVVEHQQHLLVGQASHEHIEQGLLRVLGNSEDVGHLSGHRAATRRGSASSTYQTPPGKRSVRSAASCSASRVLPHPPEPVSVTSRCSSMSAPASGELSLAADEGRQLGGQVVACRVQPRERGKVSGSSTWQSWKTCSGRPRSFSR